ncbi:hypothetical protein WA158_008112 [Blastocystis sp. Blastoise]
MVGKRLFPSNWYKKPKGKHSIQIYSLIQEAIGADQQISNNIHQTGCPDNENISSNINDILLNNDEQILNNIMKEILNHEFKRNNINTSIEDSLHQQIFTTWKRLNISQESVIELIKLVNNVIITVSNQPELEIPKRGQDFIRRLSTRNEYMPFSINIFWCEDCKKLVDFNTGRNISINSRNNCNSLNCDGSPRYTTVLPLISRIKQLLKSEKLIQDIELYNKEDIEPALHDNYVSNKNLPLYMNGDNFKEYMKTVHNNGDIFLFFTVTSDGISVSNSPLIEKNKSSQPVLIKLLNYKPIRLYDKRKFWVFTVSSTDERSIALQLLVKELLLLKDGIPMLVCNNGLLEEKRVVGILLEVYGDTAEIQKIGEFTGPASNYPCRFCNLHIQKDNDNFHKGIKTSYSIIKPFIDYSPLSTTTTIFYPIFTSLVTVKEDCIINGIKCINYTKYFKSETQSDAYSTIICEDNTKETIEIAREETSSRTSMNGINSKISVFERLPYFNAATSYNIDPMHMFNNTTVLLLSLLLGFDTMKYIDILNKHKYNKPDEMLKRLQLSSDNIKILKSRLEYVNSFFYDSENQFRFALEETSFFKMTSHSRIFFASYILPLIMSDFNQTDSLLVPLVEIQADIIMLCTLKNQMLTIEDLSIINSKCYIFLFLCDLVLPKEFINSQIHYFSHLTKSIQNAGSLQYTSTWESERFYSSIKRLTHGRFFFNKSSIISMALKEIIDIDIASSIINSSLDIIIQKRKIDTYEDDHTNNVITQNIVVQSDSSSIAAHIVTFNAYECVYYVTDQTQKIYSVKGIRESINNNNTQLFTESFLKHIIRMNSVYINNKLFSSLNVGDLTTESRIELLRDSNNLHNVMENAKKLNIFRYSEILINDSLSFTCTDIDEGVEKLDNSYLMYYDYINGASHVCLVKALEYIQIEDLFIVNAHHYPDTKSSKSVPTNVIVCDIHNFKESNEDNDEDYCCNEVHQTKRKHQDTLASADEVTTTTVFIPRTYTRDII